MSLCVVFFCVHMNSRLICMCVLAMFVRLCEGEEQLQLLVNRWEKKQWGGTDRDIAPPQYVCVCVCLLAWDPQLRASACTGWRDKDALMWSESTFSPRPRGAWEMSLQAFPGNLSTKEGDRYVPSGRSTSDLTDLWKLPLQFMPVCVCVWEIKTPPGATS